MLNVAEVADAASLTIPSFFTTVGETVSGLVGGAVGVFTGLWNAGVPGQIACTLGLAGTVIGLGAAFFKISKSRKRK